MDEILRPAEYYDLIVQKAKQQRGPTKWSLDSQIYHDFYMGEDIQVKISRRSKGYDPTFKLFNRITGFVKDKGNHKTYQELEVGSEVTVQIIGHIEKKECPFY